MQHMETILTNEFVKVVRTEEGISWFDLTDKWNGFSGFTQNTRNLPKAEAYLRGLAIGVKSRVKMGDITGCMASLNLKPHTYCAMD